MPLIDKLRARLRQIAPRIGALLRFHRLGLRARFSVLFYLVTLSAVAVIGYYGYSSASQAYREKAAELVTGYTTEVAQKIIDFLDLAQNDLHFISSFYGLQRYVYWNDLADDAKKEYWREISTDTLRGFINAYGYNYKIRFLDMQGQERIVVRRDRAGGRVAIVPAEQLQDKHAEEYFLRGRALKPGASFASALDLNRELGVIENPHVPVVRFARPMFGDNKVEYGVVVTNIFADSFFDFIRSANKNTQGRRFFLVDGDGQYLFHPDADKAFGRLLGHGASLERDYPGLLAQLNAQEQGALFFAGNVIAFRHIHPNTGGHENGFILVGLADESAALAELSGFKTVFLLLLALIIILVMVAARYYVGGLMGPLTFVTRQMERLGRGETGLLQQESFDYPAQDEIRRMLDSVGKLLTNMERLAGQADVISKGDFSGAAPLLSEQDRLGQALNNMTRMLRDAKRQDQRSNWLKDGISRLSFALTGDLTPQELADAAIGLCGRYLEAGRGVFYVYHKDQETLELLGSYMFTEREALGNRFKLGEGAVGQAAREKKPIVLHAAATPIISATPIVTGTLSLPPLHVYTYPLLREGELLGVVELAAFEHYDELKLEFLERATEVIASFLYIVEQRERVKALLGIAEEATRQAQEQSRRLQDANTMMEEQQQQLQQQSEELQASNAQMEEQQQQLQQQTEELQQTNAHLEEQQRRMEQQALALEQKNREINQSRDEINQRAEDLELASKYKSEFLANMSHELRTPLNSIILLSKMLAMNEESHLSNDEVKRASIVHHAGEELLRLINDILDLSKIESGKMELRVQAIPTRELAADFHDMFSATADEKGLAFKVEDHLQGSIVSDRDKLSQVVRNLLSNAFKFTREGSITLRFEPSGRADLPVRIAVADTGIGIAADKQKLVFEAFQQVDGSISREFGGTGLGLSISQRFAELLGGTVELRSTPGKGSTFSLLLPATPEAAARPALPVSAHAPASPAPLRQPAAIAAAPVQVHDDRANLKSTDQVILVIDDDPGFGEALMALNKRLGYKTLVATGGQEGLRMARTYRPRGILLDLGLPDMDGSEVLHTLKSNRELRRLPVYIVSARDKEDNVLRDGIAGYLQKPVNETQLADAEADVLARAARDAGSLLLLEGESLSRAKLDEIVRQDGLTVTAVRDLPAARRLLRDGGWRLAVVDLARGAGGENGADLCRALREEAPELQLILYSAGALSAEEEAALRPYTDSIIVKTPHAEQRMLENIEHFLQNAQTSSLSKTTDAGNGGKKLDGCRILVVDDDPRNLFVITSALEQHGAQVENALNGRKGLELLKKSGADLVFMDIMMPEMDGYEAIREIRADPALQRVPVVALTAKALKADREKAVKAGADDYLSKPVDYEVLVNMAKVWCEEKR
ncbi:MAG: response regulator [Sulfuricellaceae bacterium]